MGIELFGQKTLPVSLHSTMNSTWTEMGSTAGLRNEIQEELPVEF